MGRRRRRRKKQDADSSVIGRYLAQKAIRQQSRQDHEGLGLASAPAVALSAHPVTMPAGYVANELVSNEMVQGGNVGEAKKKLSEAQRGAEKRTWGEQFARGVKKSPSWALGGAAGGGLAGYFLSRMQGGPSDRGALIGALTGAGIGGAAPVAYSLFNKYVLDKLSTKKDKQKAKELLAENATRTSLMPLGDVVGAIEKRSYDKRASTLVNMLNPTSVAATYGDRLRSALTTDRLSSLGHSLLPYVAPQSLSSLPDLADLTRLRRTQNKLAWDMLYRTPGAPMSTSEYMADIRGVLDGETDKELSADESLLKRYGPV